MAVKTYDPGQVICVIGGVPMSGLAEGSMIKISRNSDAYSMVTGAQGEVSRVRSRDRSGTLTITLQQTSASNDVLSGFALADELSNSGVVPMLIKDNSGRSVFASASCWVKKMPESEFGKEFSNREWVLDLSDLNIFIGGNPTSGVA